MLKPKGNGNLYKLVILTTSYAIDVDNTIFNKGKFIRSRWNLTYNVPTCKPTYIYACLQGCVNRQCWAICKSYLQQRSSININQWKPLWRGTIRCYIKYRGSRHVIFFLYGVSCLRIDKQTRGSSHHVHFIIFDSDHQSNAAQRSPGSLTLAYVSTSSEAIQVSIQQLSSKPY